MATQITATYTNTNSASDSSCSLSSTTPFTLATPFTLPDSDSSGHKTSHLNILREAVSTLQERVNNELTTRMEEEAREIAAASTFFKSASVNTINEAAEEDNYGEEVVEDEE
ncbi:uncharacterized protein GGS22DRAFT_193505 [Annulohypoxylon maeteangense]|uniref:uncharacterized protein n=1 Tax=Annulohypoxylon maeteangense TaxID=1927788 RepID=UPI0020075AE4|nr:uncharacterized protein GGS22DRAFT_193505 [Annulohypoxylon maeteangense]KAI0880155.1 hypothetical protein GGS22DRAFT_193505 [Annulohypoxylon maeteangense]